MSKHKKEIEIETPGADTANAGAATPTPPPTDAPVELEELQAAAAKAAEHWERLVRVSADFENFKKRAAREKQEAIQYANQALLTKLVPVLDNFEMAASAATAPGANAESLKTGVTMILNQFKAALAEAGLEEVDAAGQPFDPALHEAVSQQETAEIPDGHVAQQLRKGYKLRDRLLRPATVVVAKKPAA
ncbi:MAG: nucleotide exchange factor GrpE [Verrucomicrobia bacterium]|nr:nucleotide exchange factor GrpE [Verrucomicrobiota bacterium]